MTVGPVAGRVAGGRFALNGREYRLKTNNYGNTLHSSDAAIQYKIWSYETSESDDAVSCVFSCICLDGEGGWPAERKIKTKYSLTGTTLAIDYIATVSDDTYLNITNHSYFNLTGNASKNVLDYVLSINSDKYAEVTYPDLLPTGKIADVDETVDFSNSKRLGDRVPENGYDHFYVVDGYPSFRKFANLHCPESGITMEVWSDMPGVQLYTANKQVSSGIVDKYGHRCCNYCAVCLETSFFADSPNQNWPVNCLFKKGEKLESRTEYRFHS